MRTAEPKLVAAQEWESACREAAHEVLTACGIREPPVDAWKVAQWMQIGVAYDRRQACRGRLTRLGERTAILVKPQDRPEREQWTVAHEIGEAQAYRVFERVGIAPEEAAPQQREHVANLMASGLLLPADWFERDARLLDGDVCLLKRTYATASHELILMNLLRLPELSLASVFDHGRLTRRLGNGELKPPPPLPVERRVWQRVHETGGRWEESHDGVRVQGWGVHEPGWKRELLRTTVSEGVDAPPDMEDDWGAGCGALEACEVW
jgi:hypothetical protein